MSVKFDKYEVIVNRNGTVCSVYFCSGKFKYSYSHPTSMGFFLQKYEVTQKDLARMAHCSDVTHKCYPLISIPLNQ